MESERKGDTSVLGIRPSTPGFPGVSQSITKFQASSHEEGLVNCLPSERESLEQFPKRGLPMSENAGVEG